MRVLVLSIFYNAREVVEFYMRHYRTFADTILCFDDQSTDGTREILQHHERHSAGQVMVKDWPHPGSQIDEDLFLKFYYEQVRLAGERDYDWVIIPDPDELIYAPKIRNVLWQANSDNLDMIRCVGMNLVGPHFPIDDGKSQLYEIHPFGILAPVYSKVSVVRPGADINWLRGRQGIEHCSVRMNQRASLMLLHARYFGVEYTALKNAQNYDRCPDKTVAWSCAPTHTGEHSPGWAKAQIGNAFNVLEFDLSQMDDTIQLFDTKGVVVLNPR